MRPQAAFLFLWGNGEIIRENPYYLKVPLVGQSPRYFSLIFLFVFREWGNLHAALF
jgi:hypothetical protein